MICYIIGTMVQVEAAMFLLPALTALLFGENRCIAAFLGTAMFCLAGGHLLKGKKPAPVGADVAKLFPLDRRHGRTCIYTGAPSHGRRF